MPYKQNKECFIYHKALLIILLSDDYRFIIALLLRYYCAIIVRYHRLSLRISSCSHVYALFHPG